MNELPVLVEVFEVGPAAVGVGETIPLRTFHAGEAVIGAYLRVNTPASAGSTATATVGDAGLTNRFIASTDYVITTASDRGVGTGMLTDGGYLYKTDTAVNLTYTPGTTPGTVAPKFRVTLVFYQLPI